jgi:hypothetical protein
MTEKQWLTVKPSRKLSERKLADQMLAFARDHGSERKLRLALCGLLRQEPFAQDEGVKASIELSERWADQQATDEEVLDFNKRSFSDYPSRQWSALAKPAADSIQTALESHNGMKRRLPPLLRDIFGNPFRSLACDPAWLTSTVVALAEGIYADRAFDRMPILADALQDAGCDNEDVLSHCRNTQLAHVRGCWVIDLLTGRV